MTPIIVPMAMPINYTRGGSLETKELGFILLFIVALTLWCCLWYWIADRFFNSSIMVSIGGGMLLPMVIGGLILIFI